MNKLELAYSKLRKRLGNARVGAGLSIGELRENSNVAHWIATMYPHEVWIQDGPIFWAVEVKTVRGVEAHWTEIASIDSSVQFTDIDALMLYLEMTSDDPED